MVGYEACEPPATDMDGGSGADELDRLLECLANPRRRYAIACLREHHTVTLADLADEVAVSERDQRLDEIPAEWVKRVYLSLYHRHIPILESANLVSYSQSADAVEVGDAFDQTAPFIELIEEDS